MATYTFTGTDTYSVADVEAVMKNTYEDIIGFANRGIISYEKAKSWINDLTYLLNEKILKSFEIQLYDAAGTKFKSYKYTVSVGGYLSSGSDSGGINFWSLATGTVAGLFADIDDSKSASAKVREELANRGWGTNGTPLTGNQSSERDYISNSLKLSRSVITK